MTVISALCGPHVKIMSANWTMPADSDSRWALRETVTYTARCPACGHDATWTAKLFEISGTVKRIKHTIEGCPCDPDEPTIPASTLDKEPVPA